MMDKKSAVAFAGAIGLVSITAYFAYKHCSNGKKIGSNPSTKDESVKTPESKQSVIPAVIDDEIDLSNVNTYKDAYSMARELYGNKSYEKAIKCFTKAIALCPAGDMGKRGLFFFSRGQAHMRLLNYDNAVNDFTECISATPKYSKAYENRGQAYYEKGLFDKAIRDYMMYTLIIDDPTKCSESTDEIIRNVQKKIGDKLAEEEMKRREKVPDYKVPFPPKFHFQTFFNYFISECSMEYNKENWSLVKLTEMIQSYDNTAGNKYSLGDLYLMRGGLLKSSGGYKEAFSDFTKASDLSLECSDLFSAKLELATFLSLLGKFSDSINLFKELETTGASLSGDHNWVNLYVKYALTDLEVDKNEALEVIEKAIVMYGESPDVHLTRGIIGYKLQFYVQAITSLQKSIAIRPSACEYIFLAMCYSSSDIDIALKYMKQAYLLDKVNPDVLNTYGDMLMTAFQVLSAKEKYEEAIDTNPNFSKSYSNLAALIMHVNQDMFTASSLLKTAIDKDANNIEAYLILLHILTTQHKTEEIKAIIAKALEHSSTIDELSQVLGYKYVLEINTQCEVAAAEIKKR